MKIKAMLLLCAVALFISCGRVDFVHSGSVEFKVVLKICDSDKKVDQELCRELLKAIIANATNTSTSTNTTSTPTRIE